MKRRTALRQLALLSAGATLLSRCSPGDASAGPSLQHLKLSASEYQLLKDVAATILPGTSAVPGAALLNSQDFVLIMIDDCVSPEERDLFMKGLTEFDSQCRQTAGKSFTACDRTQRLELIRNFDTGSGRETPAGKFYHTIKNYTLQSFTTSQAYLEKIAGWKLVPGPVFRGCVPA